MELEDKAESYLNDSWLSADGGGPYIQNENLDTDVFEYEFFMDAVREVLSDGHENNNGSGDFYRFKTPSEKDIIGYHKFYESSGKVKAMDLQAGDKIVFEGSICTIKSDPLAWSLGGGEPDDRPYTGRGNVWFKLEQNGSDYRTSFDPEELITVKKGVRESKRLKEDTRGIGLIDPPITHVNDWKDIRQGPCATIDWTDPDYDCFISAPDIESDCICNGDFKECVLEGIKWAKENNGCVIDDASPVSRLMADFRE
jgi:hypothetical protein